MDIQTIIKIELWLFLFADAIFYLKIKQKAKIEQDAYSLYLSYNFICSFFLTVVGIASFDLESVALEIIICSLAFIISLYNILLNFNFFHLRDKDVKRFYQFERKAP